MRGLQINNPRRDGFLRSDTTLLDSFNIERVEAIGGCNSLLFGTGNVGGVVASNSKRAYLNRRSLAPKAVADSEGSPPRHYRCKRGQSDVRSATLECINCA